MRKLFRIQAVTFLSVLLSSCATEPTYFTGLPGAIGVMLYEGSEISEELSVEAWRQPEGYGIRLWFRNSGSGGYSDAEREYMESLYPVLTQYGRKEIESNHYSYIVRTSSDITMASVGKGASVRSDKEIAGLEPGADLGDLFLLSAVSPGNAIRYRFPDYQVAGRYYLGAVTETFSSYFSEGLTFPGLSDFSSVCFWIAGLPLGATLYFEIPVEYAAGVSYAPDGTLPPSAEMFHKTIKGALTITADIPAGDPAGRYITIKQK